MKWTTPLQLASAKKDAAAYTTQEDAKAPKQPDSNLWNWKFGYILASYLIVFMVVIRVGSFWAEKARSMEDRLKELEKPT